MSDQSPATGSAVRFRAICRCGTVIHDADPDQLVARLNEHMDSSPCGFDWHAATNGSVVRYGW